MKTQEYVDALVHEIQTHGVTDWSIDWGHNHPRLSFAWEGGVITHIMPGSPSDRVAGLERNVSDLRKSMGVKRVIVKSKAVAKQRKKTFVSLSGLPTSFTLKTDPMFVFTVAIENARVRGRYAFQSGLSGVMPSDLALYLADAYINGWYDGIWGR